MHQPVHQGGGYLLVAEHLGPLLQRQVGRHHHTPPFVSGGEELEQLAWARDRRWMVWGLQDLNGALLEYDLGLGYRRVDKILTFVAAVAESTLADDLPKSDALDATVMVRVLPKFYGPLDRVQEPLHAVLDLAGGGRLPPHQPQGLAPAGKGGRVYQLRVRGREVRLRGQGPCMPENPRVKRGGPGLERKVNVDNTALPALDLVILPAGELVWANLTVMWFVATESS